MVSKLRMWTWLQDNGPATVNEIADALDEDSDDVAHCFRALYDSGHVRTNSQWELFANDADNLAMQPSPFGAGLGETRSGSPPADEEPDERHR